MGTQLAKRVGRIVERILLIQFNDLEQKKWLDFSIGGRYAHIILMIYDVDYKIVEIEGFVTIHKKFNIKTDLKELKRTTQKMEILLDRFKTEKNNMDEKKQELAKRIGRIAERVFLLRSTIENGETIDFSVDGSRGDIGLFILDKNKPIVTNVLCISQDYTEINNALNQMETVISVYEKENN